MSLPVQVGYTRFSRTLVGAAATLYCRGGCSTSPQEGRDRGSVRSWSSAYPYLRTVIATVLCSLRQLILFSHCLAMVVAMRFARHRMCHRVLVKYAAFRNFGHGVDFSGLLGAISVGEPKSNARRSSRCWSPPVRPPAT